MTKAECVTEVASKAGITKVAAIKAIETFVKLLSEAIGTREKITFPGGSVGSEQVKRRNPA